MNLMVFEKHCQIPLFFKTHNSGTFSGEQTMLTQLTYTPEYSAMY